MSKLLNLFIFRFIILNRTSLGHGIALVQSSRYKSVLSSRLTSTHYCDAKSSRLWPIQTLRYYFENTYSVINGEMRTSSPMPVGAETGGCIFLRTELGQMRSRVDGKECSRRERIFECVVEFWVRTHHNQMVRPHPWPYKLIGNYYWMPLTYCRRQITAASVDRQWHNGSRTGWSLHSGTRRLFFNRLRLSSAMFGWRPLIQE